MKVGSFFFSILGWLRSYFCLLIFILPDSNFKSRFSFTYKGCFEIGRYVWDTVSGPSRLQAEYGDWNYRWYGLFVSSFFSGACSPRYMLILIQGYLVTIKVLWVVYSHYLPSYERFRKSMLRLLLSRDRIMYQPFRESQLRATMLDALLALWLRFLLAICLDVGSRSSLVLSSWLLVLLCSVLLSILVI